VGKYNSGYGFVLSVKTGRKFVVFGISTASAMKSMLILTDFSEAAFRAAEYGCELAGSLHIKRIVLCHAYQPAFAGTLDAAAIVTDDKEAYLNSMESLGMLQDRLKPIAGPDVSFDMAAEETLLAGLANLINEQISKDEIGLVVMGVSGKSGLEKFLMGSTTTEVLKSCECPILIVPADTLIGRGIKTIIFTSDLKDVETVPTRQLYEFLDALAGKLQVVNVEQKEKYSPEMEKAIAGLHKLLEKYDPEFSYLTGNDIVEEILRFAREQQASLIITVHQQRGFLSSLFHKSVTKKLAYDSSVPLLSLPALK
jgi:nucleotide-binding universal stress UspA family protein